MEPAMNAPEARPLQGVPSQRGIPEELDRLTAGIDRLEGLFAELRTQLSPVLRESTPEPPSDDPSKALPQPVTVVAQRIQEDYLRVAQLTRLMGDVLSRCDL